MPIEKQCLNCHKVFKVKPKRRDTAKFCSRQCKHDFHRVELECVVCGKIFTRTKGILKARKALNTFCSNRCRCEHQAKSSPWNKGINIVEITCDFCSKSVLRPLSKLKLSESHFCSKECYDKWKIKNLVGENNPSWKSKEVVCDQCRKTFFLPPSKIGRYPRLFCSNRCKYKWMSENLSGENNPNWLGGHIDSRGPNWHEQRQKALERDGYTCQNCGGTNGKIDVHHIIPYRYFDDYIEANDLDNLITLCHSCHMRAENQFTKKVCLVLIEDSCKKDDPGAYKK